MTRGAVIHEGHVHTLYRGREGDGAPVILKCLDVEGRSEATSERLRREFAILRELAAVDGVVRALDLREEEGELVLVLADFRGRSLASALDEATLGLRERLGIALQVATILGEIHAAGVIHGDLKPRNILVDERRRVQIIDFGISSRGPIEASTRGLQGTLAYIAPEQSGRLHRAVDHRADLYALGVTLFELFVGRVPFIADDPAELIHAHLAREPADPRSLAPELPQALSAVILRLLAKSPDDRYRSAFGLAHDLAAIIEAVEGGRADAPLELGSADPPLLLQIPEHLYGRDDTLAEIEAAFARGRGRSPEAVLLRGKSGSGKSAVFRALRRRHVGEARFAVAAYDRGRRNVPYSALFDALAQALRELADASDEELARWRATLRRALGGLTSALTPRLPELGALLREAGAAGAGEASFGADAARNRLHRAVHLLVRALGRPQAPLVLLLDDLQWVDEASLELLVELIDETAGDGLFCVLAGDLADDDEGRAKGRIAAAIASIGQRVRVTTLDLQPLGVDAIAAMIADTLGLPASEVAELAAMVARKCGGSGLFAAELLRDLHARGILRFDPAARRWTYDLAAAAATPATANVVDLLVARASALDPAALKLLQRGACVGMRFAVDDLGPSAGASASDQVQALLDASIEARLIERRGEHLCFAHERVREAVVATLSPQDRVAHHLALARDRAATLGEGAGEAEVFALADHYQVAESSVPEEERLGAATICLRAAEQAYGSGAVEAAIVHARAAARFLGAEGWSRAYELALRVFLLELESEGSVGDFVAADATTAALLARARSDEDRAEVHIKRAAVHLARSELDAVMEAVAEAVRLLGGAPLPRRPSTAALIFGMVRVSRKIGRRTPADLMALAPLRERRDRLLMQAYAVASGTGFQSDPKVLTQIAIQMIELMLERGIDGFAAPAFITYGIAAGVGRGDLDLMEAFGRAGIELFQTYPEHALEGVARFLYHSMIAPMSHPYGACQAELQEATRSGLESGSLAAAGLAAMAAVSMGLNAGADLGLLRAEAVAALKLCERAKIGSSEWIIRVDLGFSRALLGEAMEGRLGGAGLDEAAVDAGVGPKIAPTTHYAYLHRRLYLDVLVGDGADARAVIARADPGVKGALGLFSAYNDYRALRAVAMSMTEEGASRALRRDLGATLRLLAGPAKRCPANFAALRELVAAELARVGGPGDAAEAYERAIKAASAAGNHLHEGLAATRAGRYYLGRGLDGAGRAYLVRARRAFARARAQALVERLDRAHPGLERRPMLAAPASIADVSLTLTAESTPSSSGGSSARGGHIVDLASVVKAAQVFAAEIDLEALSGRMMRIVVENAGAERGVLLVVEDAALVVAAEYSARGDRVIDHHRAPLESVGGLPQGLVLRIHRSGRAEVFDDAASDPANAGDSYIQRRRLRSALALPLQARGRGVGVVYLENNLTAGAFTEERLDVLQILAVQAAIAVDHAGFFRRLDAARDAAEAANLAKSRFLANMSHELRTPLNAILGFAEIIAEDAEEAGLDGIVDDAGKIRRAGGHLLGIVSEILDLTKVEAGHLELDRVPIDVAALLDQVAEIVATEIAAGGNALVRDEAPALGIFVGDPMRLRQILVNLLSNASKFTERGTVTLRARRGDDEELVIRVEDTGIGMAPEDVARVFQPFTQVDASSTRRYGGVGLGLTICRRLCEQMGGTIDVESELGVGSTFIVRIPSAPTPEPAHLAAARPR